MSFTHRKAPLCVNAHGFSLHAGVRCEAHDRQRLEQLCRYITRPAISIAHLSINGKGQVILKLKTSWKTAHPYRAGAAGIHAKTGGADAAPKIALDTVSRRARAQCEAESEGRSERQTKNITHVRA